MQVVLVYLYSHLGAIHLVYFTLKMGVAVQNREKFTKTSHFN